MSGEIDAVFVLEDIIGEITVIVIDWKRSLSNKKTLEQYKRQCQVYIRCIQEEPSLVNLTIEQIETADLRGFLIEIGGDEGCMVEVAGNNARFQVKTFGKQIRATLLKMISDDIGV